MPTSNLNIATLNIENIKTNLSYLHFLMESMDIICLQEHWLYNFEIATVQKFLGDMSYTIRCTDDDDPINPTSKPRGVGGIMIIWRKELDQQIVALPDGSERIQAIQVATGNQPITVINSYMPTEGSPISYSEKLDEVYEVMEKYRNESKIIWAGDLNGAFERKTPSSNDRLFKDFCLETQLTKSTHQPTYHHFIGNVNSRIDHILTHTEHSSILQHMTVEERHPLNTSSHDPVIAQLKIEPVQHLQERMNENHTPARPKPNWKKIDAERYHRMTDDHLKALIKNDGLQLPPTVLVDRLNDILLKCADACGPKLKKSKPRKNKYPWSKDMAPRIKHIKYLFYKWKIAGRKQDSHIYDELTKHKKKLRSIQRRLAASHRNELLTEISKATTDDKQLFYKLIRKQRAGAKNLCSSIVFPNDERDQLEGWANYFEDLAANNPHPFFDEEHKTSAELKYHLVSLQKDAMCHELPEPTTEDQIKKCIAMMKNNKAADVYGLTAEHLKKASSEITTLLTKLTNDIFLSKKMPDSFKTGVIVPCHKKKKPITDPNSYRRITIASNLGKVVEKIMMIRTKSASKTHQDPMQYGFTEDCSPSLCALMLTEAIAESRDLKTPLFMSFMDSSKAFDMVNHTVMLNALHDLGIDPHLWQLYKDMYSKVTSRVRIDGKLSREFREERGIRQGGETSSEAFKAKDNQFLSRIRQHPSAFRIGSISIGIPTVADDNCMLASSHLDSQTQLLMAGDNASKDRYIYNAKKSKVMTVGIDENQRLPLQLNGEHIDYSASEVHLGLKRTDDGSSEAAIRERIQIGRRSANAMMGAGLHGINGLSPYYSRILIQTYVEPAILYGLEALVVKEKDMSALDKSHRALLRQIQSLPDSTANSAIYLLVGCPPLRAKLHRKMLTLFITILHRRDSPEHQIISRQIAMKTTASNSWITQLRFILHQYSLPNPSQLLNSPPPKNDWKIRTKKAILSYWNAKLKQEASSKSSLKFLNLEVCSLNTTHHVWQTGSDPLQATMAIVKARLLLGRYPLTGLKYSGRNRAKECPLCQNGEETTEHFVMQCAHLEPERTTIMPKLREIAGTDLTPQAILDPSHLNRPREVLHKLEYMTRRLTYQLHKQRNLKLGIGCTNYKKQAKGK